MYEDIGNLSASCHGVRIVRKIVQKLLEEGEKNRSIEIMDGLTIVKTEDEEESKAPSTYARGFGNIGAVMRFLRGRELRIRLPKLSSPDAGEGDSFYNIYYVCVRPCNECKFRERHIPTNYFTSI